MPLIKSGSRQAVSTNIREMMAAGHPQKQAIAAALSTARRYAARGGAQEESRVYLPKRLEGDPVPLGMLDRASRAGTRNDVEINDQISRERDKYTPPTFEQRWRGAPQQPRFIDDEYGRMQNVYADGGDVPVDEPAAAEDARSIAAHRLRMPFFGQGDLPTRRSMAPPQPAESGDGSNYGRLVESLTQSQHPWFDKPPTSWSTFPRDALSGLGFAAASRGPAPTMMRNQAEALGDAYLANRGDRAHMRLPDGTVLRRYDLPNGGERWSRNGRWVRDPERALPPYRASGGPVGYASGGGIDVPPWLQKVWDYLGTKPGQGRSFYSAPKSPNERVSEAFDAGHYASGGDIMPWAERASGRALVHAGMIKSPVPGRTDQLPISVGGGAYVLPADHVAALGQNNSMAGANILDSMFKKGTYGAPRSTKPRMPRFGLRRKMFAEGGAPDQGKPVKIIAAGGEYVVPPEVVAELGGGDLDHGHAILDNWVKATRRNHIKTLRKLKPPKQS